MRIALISNDYSPVDASNDRMLSKL